MESKESGERDARAALLALAEASGWPGVETALGRIGGTDFADSERYWRIICRSGHARTIEMALVALRGRDGRLPEEDGPSADVCTNPPLYPEMLDLRRRQTPDPPPGTCRCGRPTRVRGSGALLPPGHRVAWCDTPDCGYAEVVKVDAATKAVGVAA